MCKIKIKNSILKEILMLILGKEVIKMKKLIIVVMAIAMVAAFAPKVDAAESAQLGLQVTFAVDQDLQRIKELKDHVYELENISSKIFDSIYVDRNQDGKVDYRDLDINGDGVINDEDVRLLKNAVEDLAHISDLKLEDVKNQLKEIAERRPDLKPQIEAVLDHAQQLQGRIHDLIEKLKSLMVQPVISIELKGPNPWVLENVKLGEKRANISPLAVYPPLVLHHIFNTGNVTVKVAIAYGPQIDQYGIPRPGLEQGLDTFITLIEDGEVLPPNEGRGVFTIGPTEGAPLNLTYGAPKELSQPVRGMGVAYDLKAYPGNEN